MRRHDKKSDYMSRKCDNELKQLEEILTALYANATNQVEAEFTDYAKKVQPLIEKKHDELVSGKITQAEYDLYIKKRVLEKALYKAMIKTLTKTLVNTDAAAMAVVRGNLPYIVAQSYNFIQSLGWAAADKAGLSIGTFQIYNADSVQKLIKDNPRLLPFVDVPADKKWNMDRINKTITHSIMQGDDMRTVAKKIQGIAKMDENAAIRTARTAMTCAENLGRDESFLSLQAKGIPVKKRWNAVLDSRTRFTHRLLNGTYANVQGLFGTGILDKDHLMRYPADPNGEPQEVYNCRCRLDIVFSNDLIDHDNDDDIYEQFMKERDPKSYEALQKRNYFAQHRIKGH